MPGPRNYVKELPADAIACSGPLMYDPNRYVSPDGRLFKLTPSTGRIIEVKPSSRGNAYFAWGGAKKLIGEEIVDMEPIAGFYVKNKGNSQVLIRALISYYFVERIADPMGMRAQLIDRNQPVSATNVHWITYTQQSEETMNRARANVKDENRFREVSESDINWDDFLEWEKNCWVRKDGRQVIRITPTGRLRDIQVVLTDPRNEQKYRSCSVPSNGKSSRIRMNRMVMEAHLGRKLTPNEVIDHLDGNTLNDSVENLEVVDHTENVRRGGLSVAIIKVDPSTMKIVERIRCIREHCDKTEDMDHRELSMRLSSGEPYQGFIWLKESDERSLYTVKDDIVSLFTLSDRLRVIRERIEERIESGKITEEMFAIAPNGAVAPTEQALSLISVLDPRGRGNLEMIEATHSDISESMPCCRLLSYFGGTDASQIFLCLKTLMIFTRSRDNARASDRNTCAFCVFNRGGNEKRFKFGHEDPWGWMPVYSYNPPRKTKANPNPLAFVAKYSSVDAAIRNDDGSYPKNISVVLKPLRYSLFQAASGVYAKTDIPKRATVAKLYMSFYPPKDGLMHEEDPSWILARRLDCALIKFMREFLCSKYADEKAAEIARYNEKKK